MAGSGASLWTAATRWARALAGAGSSNADGAHAGDELAPGSLLGGFRIERLIGRGASGNLYAAFDAMHPVPVAIKTVRLPAPDEPGANEARDRFLREAQTAARLRHPDIVQVHGAGEARGLGFIVMELLAGTDLSRYTRPSRLLPEPVVLRIGARIAEALAHAHGEGVLHRDVKPANVMVHLPTHQVKLTDFGVARLAESGRTRTGFVLGTPAFMAPEQLAGAPADSRSDLYSLAVMLFQLLTGRLPYQGDSMGELLREIAASPPLDLRAVRPDLPPALADVLALALQKHPQTRYADGRQLAHDLLQIEKTWQGADSFTAGGAAAP